MRRLLLTTVAVCGLAAPASAALVNWNFAQHPGLLGNTQTFTAGGGLFSLLARGFDAGDAGTALFSNTRGGDENGLGLRDDPTGANEIFRNEGFVQLNLDGLLSRVDNFQFSMESTTNGEAWKVFGSEDAHPFQFTLLASGSDEGILHNLPGGWDNYSFFYSGGPPGGGPGGCGVNCGANVLLGSLDATAVPEPSTWVMGIVGFGLLAGFGLHKSRKDRLNLARAS